MLRPAAARMLRCQPLPRDRAWCRWCATGLSLRTGRTSIKMVDWDYDKKEDLDNYDGPGSERRQVSDHTPNPPVVPLLATAPPVRVCTAGTSLDWCMHVLCWQINKSDEIGARSAERLAEAKRQAEEAGEL
jgi:hypothetical protein